jgi:hypothetical protein
VATDVIALERFGECIIEAGHKVEQVGFQIVEHKNPASLWILRMSCCSSSTVAALLYGITIMAFRVQQLPG